MKVPGRVYRGIEFVLVDDLPAAQQARLQSSPSSPERVKILVEGKLFENCILYSAYTEWYSRVYKSPVGQSSQPNGQMITGIPVSKS